MTLKHELMDQLRDHGPMPVAEYMARCNAHYYATRDPLGANGDFTTVPEISQIFGELIGAWAADQWIQAGCPRAQLVELGPGRGTLMRDALRATKAVAGFHDAVDGVLVENSPYLREAQQRLLKGCHPRIVWQEDISALAPLPLLLIANEFFDALPVRQFVRAGLEEVERNVTIDGDRLVFQPEGNVTREDSPQSLAVIKQIAAHIKKFGGAALVIDYGYAQGEEGDTLQALKNHGFADTLAHPGEADLTAHVDFLKLAQAASNAGVQVHGPVAQGVFLKRLGAELRAQALCKSATPEQREPILSGLERIVAPHSMGESFKVLALSATLDKPAGF